MCKMWGLVLAKHHSARGQEFVWSKMKSSCVVHDMSYWRRIELSGVRSEIENLLSPFIVSYSYELLFDSNVAVTVVVLGSSAGCVAVR
jgi:hypothetical protein